MIALDTLQVSRLRLLHSLETHPPVLSTGWLELDAVLPDHGFPKGVVELAAPHGLGGATSIALATVGAVHKKDKRAFCAWVDTEGTLYAPGVAKAGVDLNRLFIVRPSPQDAGRIAVKVANAHACEVIVIDVPANAFGAKARGRREPALRPEILIRKLALAAEQAPGGATIVLVTDQLAPRDLPWPVALRLELGRAPGHIVVKVAKDRRGRGGQTSAIVPMKTRPTLETGSWGGELKQEVG